jgi:hypothetical protein
MLTSYRGEQVEQEHNVYIDRAGKYRNMDLASSQVC